MDAKKSWWSALCLHLLHTSTSSRPITVSSSFSLILLLHLASIYNIPATKSIHFMGRRCRDKLCLVDKLLLLQLQSETRTGRSVITIVHVALLHSRVVMLTTIQCSSSHCLPLCECFVYSTRRGIEVPLLKILKVWTLDLLLLLNFNRAAGSCELLLLPISFFSLTLLSLLHNIRSSIQRQLVVVDLSSLYVLAWLDNCT